MPTVPEKSKVIIDLSIYQTLITLLPINLVDWLTTIPYSLDIGNQQICRFVQISLDSSARMWGNDDSRMGEEGVIVGQGFWIGHIECYGV